MIKTNIIKETKWKEVSIQENKFDFSLSNNKYFLNSSHPYDNNYYYPSSAGKGIDIYIIDGVLFLFFTQYVFVPRLIK
ncbi:hypothetical protein U3516DRAFT_757489 [Neocallimastix sp. 'constans']